jgi:transposase-like protein
LKNNKSPFKWRHFEPAIILLCVRWYCRYSLSYHRRLPFTMGTDKQASYPEAFTASVNEKVLPRDRKLRHVKYLNNVMEQDHRAIRRRWRAMQCFRSFLTAERTIEGLRRRT